MYAEWGIEPESLPAIVTDSALKERSGELETIYGFQSKDVMAKDSSAVSLATMARVSFDGRHVGPLSAPSHLGSPPRLGSKRERTRGLE